MLKEQHLPPLALILCFTAVHHKQQHIAKALDLLSSICTSSESSMPCGIGHRLRLWRGRASRAVRIGMEAVNGAPGGEFVAGPLTMVMDQIEVRIICLI